MKIARKSPEFFINFGSYIKLNISILCELLQVSTVIFNRITTKSKINKPLLFLRSPFVPIIKETTTKIKNQPQPPPPQKKLISYYAPDCFILSMIVLIETRFFHQLFFVSYKEKKNESRYHRLLLVVRFVILNTSYRRSFVGFFVGVYYGYISNRNRLYQKSSAAAPDRLARPFFFYFFFFLTVV